MKRLTVLAALLAVTWCGVAVAQTPRSAAGRFDYYLLALSWSPSFCADEESRERNPRQCDVGRRYSFVLHGLWPQHERGYPQDCVTRAPGPTPALVSSLLDIMPSPRLVAHQWEKHGACTGLSANDYFATARRIRESIVVPPAYRAPQRPLNPTGVEVERAFIAANPKLTPAMISVQCRGGRLREVRICVTRQGAPRACGADVRDACAGRATMPPVR